MKRAAFFPTVALPLFWLLLATVASANVAAPVQPGLAAGEPVGRLAPVAIARERLQFDLRSLDTRFRIAVRATYELRNPGAPLTTPLVFVAPDIAAGDVTLNDAPLPVEPIETLTLPESWQPPTTTPALDPDGSDAALTYESHLPNRAMQFAATIPSGESVLSVRYDAVPSQHDRRIYRAYQLGYVLAPARDWAAFGELILDVRYPLGWQLATSLPLELAPTPDDGEGLRQTGRFAGLPADRFALTAQPLPPTWQLGLRSGARGVGAIAGLWGSGWLGWRWGRWCGRRSRSMQVGSLFGALVLGGVLFAVGAGLGVLGGDRLLATTHLANRWEYSAAISSGLILFAGFWLAVAIALYAWLRGRRAVRRLTAPPSPSS